VNVADVKGRAIVRGASEPPELGDVSVATGYHLLPDEEGKLAMTFVAIFRKPNAETGRLEPLSDADRDALLAERPDVWQWLLTSRAEKAEWRARRAERHLHEAQQRLAELERKAAPV